MSVIFLTRQVGAKHLSDEEQDELIDEIRDSLDENFGVLVMPEGWGVTISDDGRDVEDNGDYDGAEEDYDDEVGFDEDEAMDGNEEG